MYRIFIIIPHHLNATDQVKVYTLAASAMHCCGTDRNTLRVPLAKSDYLRQPSANLGGNDRVNW